jgi:hypothetical protein
MPKHIINKGSSVQHLNDRLSYAKNVWKQGAGFWYLSVESPTVGEIRNLFKFIDYNHASVISQHQLKLVLQYFKCEFESEYDPQKPVVQTLKRMQMSSGQKVFTEDSFVYFFQKFLNEPSKTTTFFESRKRMVETTEEGFKELTKRHGLDNLFKKGNRTVKNVVPLKGSCSS